MVKRTSRTASWKKQARSLVLEQQLEDARELYLKVCNVAPQDYAAWIELSDISRRLGNLHEAEQACRHVLAQAPGNADALHALGAALHRQRRLDEAIACYRQALQLRSDNSETCYFLANALRETGRLDEAETYYTKTLELQHDHLFALNNLSALLTGKGRIRQATGLLERALQANPDSPQLLINYGRLNLHAGDAATAVEAYRRVVEIAPGMADAHSNLLACMNYLPDVEPADVYAEHRRWNERHAVPVQPYTHWQNTAEPDRRLRIGFVSPDLCEHSVARFIEPVLEMYDRSRFDINCYADVPHPDETTARLRGQVTGWCDSTALSHEQLAEAIYSDQVDILVDLAGHTANNRLPVFARKPAPLQVSWLGYPNTTGLDTIDYRLTDARADPPGMTESLHSESLVRLQDSFLCYRCPDNAPDVGPLPAGEDGPVIFGSFNNLAKTTPVVIATWAKLLQAVPGSRLLMKSRATGDADVMERLLGLFSDAGADPAQIIFQSPVPGFRGHMAAYNQVDIAIDTFPYNGTTTTCEALWMGVPVITLAGEVHAARVGASLLAQVGLDRLVADDVDAYIETAIRLSHERDELARLRAGLRDTLRNSSLCDANRFTRSLEEVLCGMWVDWCRQQQVD